MSDRIRTHRSGFTAIELLIVIAVMTVLTSMTMPFLMRSLQRGRVNEGVNHIAFTIEEARQAALLESRLASQLDRGQTAVPYGVRIVSRAESDDGSAYVVLLGWDGTGDLQPEEIGERRHLNPNVDVFGVHELEQVHTGTYEIFFTYRTAFPGTLQAGNTVQPFDHRIEIRVATTDAVWNDDEEEPVRGLGSSLTLYPYVGAGSVR